MLFIKIPILLFLCVICCKTCDTILHLDLHSFILIPWASKVAHSLRKHVAWLRWHLRRYPCRSAVVPNYEVFFKYFLFSPMDRVLDSGSEGPGFDTRCQIKTHRLHWNRRARKICGRPKSRRCVRTMSPKLIVGCQLRSRPRHLTVFLNYEA